MSKPDLWLFYSRGTPYSGTTPDCFHWDGSVWQPVTTLIVDEGGITFSLGPYWVRHFRDRYMSPDGAAQMIAGIAQNASSFPTDFSIPKWQRSDNSIRDWLFSDHAVNNTSYQPMYPADVVPDPASAGAAYIPLFNTQQIAHWDGSSTQFTGYTESPGPTDLWSYLVDPWPGWGATLVTLNQYFGSLPTTNTFLHVSTAYTFYHNSQWYFTTDAAQTRARVAFGSTQTTDFSALMTAPSMGAPPTTTTLVKLFKLFSNTSGGVGQEVYPLPPVKWSGNVFIPTTKVSMNPSHITGDDLDWLYMLDASGTLHTAHSLTGFWDTGRGENGAAGLGIYLQESTNTLYAFVATGKNMNTGGGQGDNPPGNRLHVLRLDAYSGGTFTWTEIAHVDAVTPSTISYNLAVTTDDTSLFICWTYETTARVYTLDLSGMTFTATHVDFGINDVMFLRSMKAGRSRAQLIGV